MDALQIVWFGLIAVLWTGYFVLEGFDFGVGILSRVVARDDVDRRVVINTIGPVWDGNEVWLLTAGGATFAAFPEWYATMFSAFYLPLLLILVALIVRGVAFEYRHKVDSDRWRRAWDEAIFWGSLLPALLWGVAFGNIVRGLAISESEFTGTVLDLLTPFALVGGLVTLTLFTLHGATYLALKTTEPLAGRARAVAVRLAPVVVALLILLLGWSTYAVTAGDLGVVAPTTLAVLSVVAVLVGWGHVARARDGVAFAATALSIGVLVAATFVALYPRVMPSTLGAAEDMTIASSAASDATLTLMTIVALVFTPLVVAYQAWTYWVFRRRVSREQITGPTESPVDVLGRMLGGPTGDDDGPEGRSGRPTAGRSG